jgi:4-amino-4-deoxy-L-arabinose transferase-like glycosyltransferase
MASWRAVGWLVFGSSLLRVAWGAALPPGPDEAYYALFASHPAWSYHDHPPMVMVIERVGLALGGWWGLPRALALRLGFVVLFAGSTLVMARLAGRVFGKDAGFVAALLLNVAGYFGFAAGMFALPDGPLVFFWLLTLDRLVLAVERPERTGRWIAVGAAWAGALLSKYQAVFLPAGVLLFLATDRRARIGLRQRGPYLAVAVGLLGFVPVIAWNAAHGWGSFGFQAGRALGPLEFRPDRLAAFAAGQAAYLLPWVWLPLVVSGVKRLRRIEVTTVSGAERLLICQAVLPVTVFLAIAAFRPSLPHWSLVGYLGLIPLVAKDWTDRARLEPARLRRRLAVLATATACGVSFFVVHARWGPVGRLAGMDPSIEMHGWDRVAAELRRRGWLDHPGTFLFTGRWYDSGRLAFAVGPGTPVLCYSPRDARGFAHWSRPGDWVGRDGVLVVARESSTEPQVYDRWFERIEPLGHLDITRAGSPARRVWFYRCRNQTRPFPFAAESEEAPSLAQADRVGAAR